MSGNSPDDRRRRLMRAWVIAPLVPFVWVAVPAYAFGPAGLLVAALVLWGTIGLAGLPLYTLMRRFARHGLVEYVAAATLIAVLHTAMLALASDARRGTFAEQFVDYFSFLFPPMAVGGLLFWFLVERRRRQRPLDPHQ